MIGVVLGRGCVAVDVSADDACRARPSSGGGHAGSPPGTGVVTRPVITEITEGGYTSRSTPRVHLAGGRLRYAALRRRGRHVQVGLLLGGQSHAAPDGPGVSRELEIYGSHGMPARDYPPMLTHVTVGRCTRDG